jgi:uncharacterized phage protein (TIGR02216 family)
LRLSPELIWQLTPTELALARDALFPPAAAPPTRHGLDALMSLYPDPVTEPADDRSR